VRYNRQLLLHEPKRSQVLALQEVQQYGADSFGDPEYVSLYGLTPTAWYVRGVRILGRTAVECTRGRLGDLIGRDIADIARTAFDTKASVVIDTGGASAVGDSSRRRRTDVSDQARSACAPGRSAFETEARRRRGSTRPQAS
jgi:hypothetical protein